MSKKEAILLISIVIIITGGFYYYIKYIYKPKQIQQPEIVTTIINENPSSTSGIQKWELPKELKEISSNVFVDADRMACIQDNKGIIFLYNLQNRNIEEKIEFAAEGDYESLALVDKSWFVLRSDGFLIEIQSQEGKKHVTKTFDLPLKMENETEAMAYDSPHNRLLIAVKEKDLSEKDKKGVYSFDLKTKQMSTNAIFYIESFLENDGNEKKKDKKKDDGNDGKKKKDKSEIKPSEIAIHPSTGEIYVLDGPSSRLFVADSVGNIKTEIKLDKKLLPQPEGLCFNSKGELYISSEAGKNENGVIVKLDQL